MNKKIITDVITKKPNLNGEQQKSGWEFFDNKNKGREEEKIVETKKSSGKLFYWLLVTAIVLVIFFWGVNSFSKTILKITPVQKNLEVGMLFNASENPNENEIALKIMEIGEKVSEKTIIPTQKESVKNKASGIVIVYNTGTKAQTLIADTRFQTPEGLIFKSEKGITVPPGKQMEVRVLAEKAGQEYNVGLKDFTIPGFKGTAKYEKIYGRSKTEMLGGFVGEAMVVTQAEIDKATTELQKEISDYLTEKMSKQVPEEYLLLKGAVEIKFENLASPRAGDAGESFSIKERGTANGFLFKKEDVENMLSVKYFGAESENATRALNFNGLGIKILNNKATSPILNFSLGGNVLLIKNIEKEAILKDLMALKDKDYKKLFNKYSNIEVAEIIYKPSFWQFVPSDPERVLFEEVIKASN